MRHLARLLTKFKSTVGWFWGLDERGVVILGDFGVGVEDFSDSGPRGTGGSSGRHGFDELELVFRVGGGAFQLELDGRHANGFCPVKGLTPVGDGILVTCCTGFIEELSKSPGRSVVVDDWVAPGQSRDCIGAVGA